MREFRVKIFADGADKAGMLELAGMPWVKGFTTNPTLMRKAGVSDYEAFAHEILGEIRDRPISFEVFADAFDEMERQAHKIAAWGPHVYVKIPITNTRGESSVPLIGRLSRAGIRVNVTAMMTPRQVEKVLPAVIPGPGAYVSLFAGRVADTGRDPVPMMQETVAMLRPYPHVELIWASPREVLNIVQADEIGCHIITVTHDLLKKLSVLGKDLDVFSLETVKMFHEDASKAGYSL